MHSLRSFYLATLVFVLPLVAFAASPTTFKDLVDYAIKIMNSVIGTLVVAGLVLYFFGIVRHMVKKEYAESAQSRKFLLMGVVVLFVMVSIWGILEILDNTLRGQTFSEPASKSSSDVFVGPSSFE